MKKIKTVDSLIQALVKATDEKKDYLEIMSSVDIPAAEFDEYCCWKKEKHTRNVVYRTMDFELLLACWEKGQISTIHDYDARRAWIHPVIGMIREEKFRLNPRTGKVEQIGSHLLDIGDFSYMSEPGGIHRYKNAFDGRTATLHLYRPSVDKWRIYDEKTGETREIITPYDTALGHPVDEPL